MPIKEQRGLRSLRVYRVSRDELLDLNRLEELVP
jgi:hypothetical protein